MFIPEIRLNESINILSYDVKRNTRLERADMESIMGSFSREFFKDSIRRFIECPTPTHSKFMQYTWMYPGLRTSVFHQNPLLITANFI